MVAEHLGAAPRSAKPRATGVLARLCFAAVAAYVTLLAVSFATGFWLIDKQGRGVPTDFVNVWAAGRLVQEGRPAAAYDWAIHERVEYAGVGYDFGGYYGWHYPPAFLFVAAALAVLPYAPALVAWMALTLPLYMLAIRRILGDGIGYLAACAFPAALWNTAVGQNGFLTAALFGGGLTALPKRPMLAGVCFGLLTYKPQFGLLIPIALAAGGHWRMIAVAAATGLALHGASWAAFGTESFAAFLANMAQTNQAVFGEGRAHLDKMQSLYGLLRALGAPATAAWTAQGALSVAAAIAVAAAWRTRLPHALKAAALAVGALLASPYVYVYDQVLLAVPIAFLLRDRLNTELRPIEWIALAAAGLLILTFPAWDLPTGWFAVVIVAGLVGREVALDAKAAS
ncbi:MAG: DUF2029 domain-containing protein [Alphaproteobacteria bacterium]|nr:DUF2029 domain-containing protein [Alphaproteobacteria bacterium]